MSWYQDVQLYSSWLCVNSLRPKQNDHHFQTYFLCNTQLWWINTNYHNLPDSKVHGANMGPIWVLLAPGRPHVGPINLAIRASMFCNVAVFSMRIFYIVLCCVGLWNNVYGCLTLEIGQHLIVWARFVSLAPIKLRLCSANHRPGYWSNLTCDWPSTAWAYS